MNDNVWRNMRIAGRFVVYICILLVVLLPVVCIVSFLLNPFDGTGEFINAFGVVAKRSMDEWPAGIDPAKIKLVSRKYSYSIDSYSVWYKIELDASLAQSWADAIHAEKMDKTRQSLQHGDGGLEGVRRVILGPPPMHWKTGTTPGWWDPPSVDFHATEAMKWYARFESGVGQATYTGYDVQRRILWVYDYACQHDRLWEPHRIPEGDVYARTEVVKSSEGPETQTNP